MKKQRIWEILEISKENDQQSKIFDYFISILICLNVLAIILETEKRFFGEYETFFRYFEIVSMIIFTIEYFLRFWSCTVEEDYRHPVIGRIKYFYSPMALIDFIAISLRNEDKTSFLSAFRQKNLKQVNLQVGQKGQYQILLILNLKFFPKRLRERCLHNQLLSKWLLPTTLPKVCWKTYLVGSRFQQKIPLSHKLEED